jgi:hypothetical protein
MRRLILVTAVHGAGTCLLAVATPGLVSDAVSGDTGAGLVLLAGWAAVELGARTALAVLLSLLWHALRASGMSVAPLRAAALRIAPRAARTALTAALGGSLAAAALTGPAAAASPSPAWPLSPTASSSPDPAWPLSDQSPAPRAPDPDEQAPAPDEQSTGRPEAPAESQSEHHVVVAGENLWQIAAQRHPDASAAQLARAVDDLCSANRSVIGADANLILPGQRLVLP